MEASPRLLYPSSSDSEFETAIAEAFKPEQERQAVDICERGTNGTEHIRGVVFHRGRVEDGQLTFSLTTKLARRAHILLSGSIANHLSALPILTGAIVRLSTQGLVLEDYNHLKIDLTKRFAWREGVIIHVHHPKSGQEVFVDTFATGLSEESALTHTINPTDVPPPSPSAIPQKRKRTSPPRTTTFDDAQTVVNAGSMGSSDEIAGATIMPPDNMLVDLTEPATAPPLLPPTAVNIGDVLKATEDELDSHNPQSLPSPPPEQDIEVEGEERNTRQEYNSEPSLKGQRSHSRPSPDPDPGSAEDPRERKRRPEAEPPDDSNIESATAQARKRLRHNQDRRTKKHRKHAAAASALNANTREECIDAEDDQYYWDTAERDIPNHLLVEETGQQEVVVDTGGPNDQSPLQEPKPEPASQPPKAESADPWASLRIGCPTTLHTYVALVDFHGGGTKCIMGVVDSASTITQTKNGEYMARFSLVDPTNFGTTGLNVTLFEKSEKMIPRPELGDVLLLRNMLVHNFNGAAAVGASYKGWQWAVFSVKTGKISSAPPEISSSRHFKPEKNELHHSLRLGDWWRDVSANAVSFGIDLPISVPSRRTRPHKLMSEAQADRYFDCTVEVVHGFQNDNSIHNIYTLFVTDYTCHPSASPTQGSWCPPQLAEIVMPVELWEGATAVGPKMQPGEFYSIRNIKLRLSGGGYMEGKMVEGEKITKLDEDELENQPHLVALLKRKQEWEAKMMASGGVHEFPHQLIEEVEKDRHFNCTVEVVHISPKEDYSYLYMTDYTTRPDLVPVSTTIVSHAPPDGIVRVSLKDAQAETGKNLVIGDFVAIRNLRLRGSGSDNQLSGHLGGDQRLISRLNPKATGNGELRALLRRKEAFEAAKEKNKAGKKANGARGTRQATALETQRREASISHTVAKGKGRASEETRLYVSLREVKESETCPAVFRVRARVVDFFPDDLRDCTVLRCTSCKETIPQMRRRCTKCDDAMEDETFVRAFFQLYFRIADEDGNSLDVSVSDERCSVLQDLVPDDVYEEDGAFDMLVGRLKPLLGDLLVVSGGEACRRPVSQDEADETPLLDLTLGNWLPESEPDAPESRLHIVLKHSACDSGA
ncbi:hypothetical protein C8Q74DRAFT_1322450 [Fomes fomentarius]|nr:hypothetical protein C8Q74DRAFT_1322450 [Fomes fomentarius]